MPNTETSKPAAKFPSFNWIRGVSDDKRISVIHRFILVRLCTHRDEKRGGQCDPGYDTVAKELGIDRKTVMGAVDVAVRRGWFAPPIKGRRENLKFIFTFPADQEVRSGGTSRDDQEVRPERTSKTDQEVRFNELRSPSEGVKKSVKKEASQATSNASSRHGHLSGKEYRAEEYICQPSDFASPDSKEDAPPNPGNFVDKKNDVNEVAGRKRKPKASDDADNVSITDPDADHKARDNVTSFSDGEIEAGFAEFIAISPRKDAPEKTRRTYRMVVVKRGVPPAKINAAMKAYAAERAGQDHYWTMKPANWLNDGCYDSAPPGTGESVTIDHETGDVIDTPPTRRSQTQGIDEAVEQVRARYPGNKWD